MSSIRYMTNDDLLAYQQLCTICYNYTNTGEPELLTDEALHAYRGVFSEDGQLLSAMMQIPYQVRFCDGSDEGGQTVKLVGIGGVVSDPSARKGGNIRRIFETDLPRLYQEGYVFSALYPFSYRFYGKFGYTWAEFWRNAEIPRECLRGDLRQAEKILRVLPEADDRGMAAIYEKYIADKNLAMIRDDKLWARLRKGTPWDSLKHAYVLHVDGQPSAYWIGRMQKHGYSTTLHMQDMAWTCQRGLEAIFAMIRGMNEVEKIALRVQSDFEPRLLVNEAYDVDDKGHATAMVRVVNVERALALLIPPVLPGSITIEVQDDQIPDNCGRFTVSSDGYSLVVEKVEGAAPDLRCDIRSLTALVMGRHRFADAVEAGVAEVLSPKKARFAALLFAERRLHMNHNF